jgi:polyhydroxyalkanoate synthesis regulator phasin
MADKKTKANETDTGTLGRLSKAGEDALTKFLDELGKNERVTDALGKASSAKGKLDDGAKRALGGVGLAAAEELKDLRKHVERLEKRLAKLEAESKPKPKPKPKASTASGAKKPGTPPSAGPPAAA